jgi:hypothetical protein
MVPRGYCCLARSIRGHPAPIDVPVALYGHLTTAECPTVLLPCATCPTLLLPVSHLPSYRPTATNGEGCSLVIPGT